MFDGSTVQPNISSPFHLPQSPNNSLPCAALVEALHHRGRQLLSHQHLAECKGGFKSVVVGGFTKNMSKVKVGMYIKLNVVYIILLASPKSSKIYLNFWWFYSWYNHQRRDGDFNPTTAIEKMGHTTLRSQMRCWKMNLEPRWKVIPNSHHFTISQKYSPSGCI